MENKMETTIMGYIGLPIHKILLLEPDVRVSDVRVCLGRKARKQAEASTNVPDKNPPLPTHTFLFHLNNFGPPAVHGTHGAAQGRQIETFPGGWPWRGTVGVSDVSIETKYTAD